MAYNNREEDVESQAEPQLNESDLPVSSVRSSANKRESWKKVVAGVSMLAAVVVVITVPVAMLGNDTAPLSMDMDSGMARDFYDDLANKPETYSPTPKDEPVVEEFTPSKIETYPPTEEEKDGEVSPVEAEPVNSPVVEKEPVVSDPVVEEYSNIVRTQSMCPDTSIAQARNVADGNETSAWIQIGSEIYGEATRDNSGGSIDMSADGSIIAIAAIMNDGAASRAGHVRVYKYDYDSFNYTQLGQDIDGEAERDWFGTSLAMDASGRRVAAGAMFADAEHGINSGNVRVFDYDDFSKSWEQIGNTVEGKAEGDRLGASVSLSADGKRLAVGATHADGLRNATDVGHVYIYELEDDYWKPIGGIIAPDGHGDVAGNAISLSADGDHVAVGAPRHDDPTTGATDVGRVRVYRYSPPFSWFQVGDDITSTSTNQQSGVALTISHDGSRVVVSYPEMTSGFPLPGITRVYDLDNESWVQVGNELLGSSFVSMAETGRIAVGDYSNYRNGMNSGTVRVYDFNEEYEAWAIVGQEVHGNVRDMSGIAAVLSADGSRVAISSPLANSEEHVQAGAVRVYDLCSTGL